MHLLTRSRKIAIVTSEFDSHTDVALLRLREMGHDAVRLHPTNFTENPGFSVRLDRSQFTGALSTDGRTILPEEIGSVWWRRPHVQENFVGLGEEEEVFAKREVKTALRGLWGSLDCYWMSRPDLIEAANHKIEQLRRATRMGFDIPRTLITNQADQAIAFCEECGGKMIYKTLSCPALGAKKGLVRGNIGEPISTMTTLLTMDRIGEHAESIAAAPCLFQEYIEKTLEYRVTIIGRELFVAELLSQEHAGTKVDWRDYHSPMVMRQGRLPDEVAQRCLDFVESYGLNYSAMDLILTPDGRHVFIENNPNGQWLFVENKVPELKMTKALLGCLLSEVK